MLGAGVFASGMRFQFQYWRAGTGAYRPTGCSTQDEGAARILNFLCHLCMDLARVPDEGNLAQVEN